MHAGSSRHFAGFAAYFLMLLIGIGGFLLIRAVGESGAAAPEIPAAASTSKPHQPDVIFHVLATLAAVMTLGYGIGRICRWIGQPPVIGEVIAGICLGPSLLGAISPDLMHLLIPAASQDPSGQVTAAVKMIAQLGVILYMFIVGLDLNGKKLKHQIHAAVAISHVSIIAPFLLGAVISLWLHADYAPAGIPFTSFSLFLGVAMSITAFPVLARILTDRGLESTRLGSVALACAAADDATAWCLLALVVGIVQTKVTAAAWVCVTTLCFIAAMFLVVKPLLRKWCRQLDARQTPLPSYVLVASLVAALLAALVTEVIGIHAIFGAFLLGAVIPSESRVAQELKMKLRDAVTILLLPAFFAFTGMRTQIGLVSGGDHWIVCLVIIFVATLGKFGGTLAAARFTGIGWRDAAALGTLMNTRGLMELIVLNIGLDLGVISPTLFAVMVLMALATTMATAPMLSLLMADFGDTEQDLNGVSAADATSAGELHRV